MVNNPHYTIPQVEENNNHYTAHDVKRDDHARQFQLITGQLVDQTLHAIENIILQNFPILREYVGTSEEIYGHIVPHLQGKIVHHKVHNADSIIVKNYPQSIIDR